MEAKSSGNFRLKAGYVAEEQKVWSFSVNKNYYIKDIINKIKGEKDNCLCKVSLFYVFKARTMHYRSGRTEAFCAKTVVIKTL